jgi:GNAT superfamily N-acetyltransferase
MTLEIRLISHEDVLGRADLLEDHYQELATDKARMQLAPHEEAYANAAENDLIFTLGVFDRGEMVGYSVNFVHPNLHYRHLVVCENDVLFLAKPYRNAGTGSQLIAATEEEAKKRGAGFVLWHAKPNTPLQFLLTSLGHGVQDIIFSRGL